MTKVYVTEQEVVPTGEYAAVIAVIAETTGQYGDQFQWDFMLGGDYEGRQLRAWCSISGSVKSKFAQWAAAAGVLVTPGEEINTDDLIGREVRVVVVEEDRDDGSTVSKIKAVKPKRNGGTAKSAGAILIEPDQVKHVHNVAHEAGFTREGWLYAMRTAYGYGETKQIPKVRFNEVLKGITDLKPHEVEGFNTVALQPDETEDEFAKTDTKDAFADE